MRKVSDFFYETIKLGGLKVDFLVKMPHNETNQRANPKIEPWSTELRSANLLQTKLLSQMIPLIHLKAMKLFIYSQLIIIAPEVIRMDQTRNKIKDPK